MISRKTIEMTLIFKRYNHSVEGISIFVDYEKNRAICYTGRKKKADWYKLFNDKYQMILCIENTLKSQYARNEKRKEKSLQRKKDAVEYRKNIKVGDIFCTSWGYDCTIVDFFQVVDKPSPATVVIRQLSNYLVSGCYNSGRIKPTVNNFISEEITCRLDQYGNICKADRYGHKAYKTSADKEHYISRY